jgi:hypothetical protein
MRFSRSDHVANLRAINVTPHVTQNASLTSTGKRRQSAIDARTTRHEGYGMSQSRRAMIECIFGWGKQHGTMRKTKHRGIAHVAADFLLNLIAYNLIRIPNCWQRRRACVTRPKSPANEPTGLQTSTNPEPGKGRKCLNCRVFQRAATSQRARNSYCTPDVTRTAPPD